MSTMHGLRHLAARMASERSERRGRLIKAFLCVNLVFNFIYIDVNT